MGWSEASEIFDVVAKAMIEADVEDAAVTHVTLALIEQLQAGDWDTEIESLQRFRAYRPIAEAFRLCGIRLS